MLDWLYNMIAGWLDPIPRRRNNKPFFCEECGRKYSNADSAAICSDWDKTLGDLK